MPNKHTMLIQWSCHVGPSLKTVLEKKLKQIPHQNISVPRSCISSRLAAQNVFTQDILG